MVEAFSAISWSEISFETRKRRVSFFVFLHYDDHDFFVGVANQEARSPSLPPDFTFFLGFRKRTDEGRGIECFCHPRKKTPHHPFLALNRHQ